ncbi:MAG: SLC13 family permease [Acidimicrobiales bacterium]
MTEALDALRTVMPALAFLLAGVPLASLLDDLGFFDAVAARLQARWPELPVVALWALAAVTTIVLNLDTTIVLLTPLYLRLARRSGSTRSWWRWSRCSSRASRRRCCRSPT